MKHISKKQMPALASILTRPSGIAGFNEWGDIVAWIITFLQGLLSPLFSWLPSFFPQP